MSSPKQSGMDHHLLARIEPVLKRANRVRFFGGLALVWVVAALLMLGFLISNLSGGSFFEPLFWLPVCALLILLSTITFIVWHRLTRKSVTDVARLIEQRYEELDSNLLTAMEQRPDKKTGLYNFLQYDVIRNAVYHSYKSPWTATIPRWRLFTAPMATVGSLIAVVGLFACYWIFARPIPVDPSVVEFNKVASTGQNYTLIVEPGHVEVESGTSLMVLARFGEDLPPDAMVVYESMDADGNAAGETQLPMSKSLADPVFGVRIPEVSAPMKYRVDYADRSSDTFEVSVFEFPKLIRSDAELAYPKFTKLDDKLIQDVRRISAVAGTELTLKCFLNKSVKSARLKSKDGSIIDLSAGTEQNLYQTSMTLEESQRLELLLTDDQGRSNRSPIQLVINVAQNKAPDVKLVQPTSDLQVSPLEEVDLKANAWDDFGLERVGLSYSINGETPNDIVLGETLPAKKQNALEHLLELEILGAKPDELVSYHFWAEDLVGGQHVRRSSSDMFFAEVRHFEEIFRQGQAPPGGQQAQQQQGQQSQNAQQAEQLGELQKQIINATWKVIRSETRAKVSEQFLEMVTVIRESQESALQQVIELTEQLEDQAARGFANQVRSNMEQAIQHLLGSTQKNDASILNQAMSAEQKAYQGLLKLRAREHEVAQQQQQQMQPQSGQQNQRSQQQLQQLQLQQDENRYETERQAQPEQKTEQQEDRQVLSRLRELSRRQNDLNERIKELQSALDEADDEKEREDIERELKRLQEEQEQIMRDAEELQERMEQDQNQQRMSEEAQQLEEARENIRRSNEALQNGELTQAAAEGTRAEREIRELRDEFQQRTSDQFSEEMRDMRDQARELNDDQNRIAEELNQLERDPRSNNQSLTEGYQRQQLTDELTEQSEKVEELRENIRQTIEKAEEYEPLLAEELYETYRQSEQDRPTQALESAEQWLRRGFDDDARIEQRQAQQGVERIREGVDRAAERVLGDETEALRRANQELERLSREINEEAREEAGDIFDDENAEPQNREEDSNSDSADEQPGEGQPGENQGKGNNKKNGKGQSKKSGEQSEQPGEGKPGEGQPGEGQPGEGKPGEEKPGEENDRPNSGEQPGDQEGEQPGSRQGGDQPGQEATDQRQGRPRGDASGLGGNQNDPIPAAPARPLTGDEFLDWSDRLRDVEEMVPDQKMRAEATRIRENARQFRQDLKRHSKEPNWNLVKLKVIDPLVKLQNEVADELIRRSADDEIVPVDRDPVPVQYEEAVRKYYEQLGTGK